MSLPLKVRGLMAQWENGLPLGQLQRQNVDLALPDLAPPALPLRAKLIHQRFENQPPPALLFQLRFDEKENTNTWSGGFKRLPSTVFTPASLPQRAPLLPLRRLSQLPQRATSTAGSPTKMVPGLSSRESGVYHYLCRVAEIRLWVEEVIGEPCCDVYSFPQALRNGVYLAKVTREFAPQFVARVHEEGQQFKYTENINNFFKLLRVVRMPALYTFELTDLYDGKHIPKVIFCLHVLAHMLRHSEVGAPEVPQVDSLPEDPAAFARCVRDVGPQKLPNFDAIERLGFGGAWGSGAAIGPLGPSRWAQGGRPIREPTPEPVRVPSPTPVRAPTPVVAREPTPELVVPRLPTPEAREPSPELEISRGPLSSNTTPDELSDFLATIVAFQALARGLILRYNMFVDRHIVRQHLCCTTVYGAYGRQLPTTLFAALCKGTAFRRLLARQKHHVELFEPEIVGFQTAARRALARRRGFSATAADQSLVVQLQLVIRGRLTRTRVASTRRMLVTAAPAITSLQSLVRAHRVYLPTQRMLSLQQLAMPSIRRLQALCRGVLVRRNSPAVLSLFAVSLQLRVRGHLVRRQRTTATTTIPTHIVVDLQLVIRGGLVRNRLNIVLDTLDYTEMRIKSLVALWRGKQARKRLYTNEARLHMVMPLVVQLQLTIRGVLSRFAYDSRLDDLEECEAGVSYLQALARGALVRSRRNQMLQHYRQHTGAVVAVQLAIRGHLQHLAYRRLTLGAADVTVIRRFAHLLDPQPKDAAEEQMVERLSELVADLMRENSELEHRIEQLGLRLALLHRNRLTLEEFAQPTPAPSFPKGLTKHGVARLDYYKDMFYLLQTRPQYLGRVLVDGVKEWEEMLGQLFPSGGKRERFHYVNLVWWVLGRSIRGSSRMEEPFATKGSADDHSVALLPPAWGLLHLLNQSPLQRDCVKEMMYPGVSAVIDNEDLDFEADPIVIHRGVTPEGTQSVGPQEAMAHRATHDRYVSNLVLLRDHTAPLLHHLVNNVAKLPLHMRVLCRQVYNALTQRFRDRPESKRLAYVGRALFRMYLADFLTRLDRYGVDTLFLNTFRAKSQVRSNLAQVAFVAEHVIEMRHFGPRHFHLLNLFVDQWLDGMALYLRAVIDVPPTIEEAYGMSGFDDLAGPRPVITVKAKELLKLHKQVKRNVDRILPMVAIGDMHSMEEDPLRLVLVALEKVPVGAADVAALGAMGTIQLALNPSAGSAQLEAARLADKRIKLLFTQAKRGLMYHIRVQTECDDLFGMLILKVTEEYQEAYEKVVANEAPQGQPGQYVEVRKVTLALLLELEQLNQVLRADNFHLMLAQMAIDIRTKHEQRVGRKRQLHDTNDTQQRLMQRNTTLKRECAQFQKFMDQVMAEAQKEGLADTRKWFQRIPDVTRRYLQRHEIRRLGGLPKFGFHKISAKKLMDSGVLADMAVGLLLARLFGASRTDFVFLLNEAGVFRVLLVGTELQEQVTMEGLLDTQFEGKREVVWFNRLALFDTDGLIGLLRDLFYKE